MRIVGLITEYNPFHNGHLHHLQESLRVADADASVGNGSTDMIGWEQVNINRPYFNGSRASDGHTQSKEGEGGKPTASKLPLARIFSLFSFLKTTEDSSDGSGRGDNVPHGKLLPSFGSTNSESKNRTVTATNTGTSSSGRPAPKFTFSRSKSGDEISSDSSSRHRRSSGGYFANCCVTIITVRVTKEFYRFFELSFQSDPAFRDFSQAGIGI